MQETWVPSLGWEDPLEKGKVAHFSILAWRIHGLQSTGSQKVRHDWATFTLQPSGSAHSQAPPTIRPHPHSGPSYQAPLTLRPLLPSGPAHTQVPPIRLHSHSGPSYHQAPPTPRPLRIWNPLIHRPFPLLLEIPSLFFYGSEPRRSKISPSFSTCWRLGCNI